MQNLLEWKRTRVFVKKKQERKEYDSKISVWNNGCVECVKKGEKP